MNREVTSNSGGTRGYIAESQKNTVISNAYMMLCRSGPPPLLFSQLYRTSLSSQMPLFARRPALISCVYPVKACSRLIVVLVQIALATYLPITAIAHREPQTNFNVESLKLQATPLLLCIVDQYVQVIGDIHGKQTLRR